MDPGSRVCGLACGLPDRGFGIVQSPATHLRAREQMGVWGTGGIGQIT